MTPQPDQVLGPRILVADDEVSLRTVLASILRREGFRVSTVKHGQEALEVLHNSLAHDKDDFFNLLISDIKMPQMDGMQLLEKVVLDFPKLPVIILSADATVKVAVAALKQGAIDFIAKPYDCDEIISAVRKAIAPNNLCAALDEIEPVPTAESEISMKDIVRQATLTIERDLIIKALNETHGNVTHAARRLKISRKSLQLKMKEQAFFT